MADLNLSNLDKSDIQKFHENLQNYDQREVEAFKTNFAHGNESSWKRFIIGAYNHPITWWIGIIQLQMQMGIWGPRHRAAASLRASTLGQVTAPLRKELVGALQGQNTPILNQIIDYNFKNRKADIAGRLAGGTFTNYASTGGRLGNKRLGMRGKSVRTATNFTIASYGAAIKAIKEGHRAKGAIIQSILTGRSNVGPSGQRNFEEDPLTDEERKTVEKVESVLSGMTPLIHVSQGPVSIREFCTKPENIDLDSICK